MRAIGLAVWTLLAGLLAGCSTYEPVYFDGGPRPHAARATRVPEVASVLYDGMSGETAHLTTVVAGWGEVDLVAFGEVHGHLEGAAAQLQLLEALAAHERPLALAMEFFERDTQADLDAYLAGELDKDAFLKRTKRSKAYAKTHGPLIEYCKANGIPVIAANAPRRLVSGYRKSGKDYESYVASLAEADRAFLPEETTELDDEYRAKFMQYMGPERGARIFKSQSLWDDAMAEAITDFREDHPRHRVLLVVGGFHVRGGLGTVTKYRMRRGKHEVRIVVMDTEKDPALPFREEDRGTGDLVLKVPPQAR